MALESAAAAFDERRVVFGVARTAAAAERFNLTGEVSVQPIIFEYEIHDSWVRVGLTLVCFDAGWGGVCAVQIV